MTLFFGGIKCATMHYGTKCLKLLKRWVGKRIQTERRKKGFNTQAQLAEAMGVDTTTVGRWESGIFFPEDDKTEKLFNILGIKEEEFLPGDNKTDSPAIKPLLEAVENLENENQQLKHVLSKIPSEWIARLAVKQSPDFGAIAARAFLTGDLSELRALKLPRESADLIAKLVARNE